MFPLKYISFIALLPQITMEDIEKEDPALYKSLQYWKDHLEDFGFQMDVNVVSFDYEAQVPISRPLTYMVTETITKEYIQIQTVAINSDNG
jgi:hypothetical protein